MKRSETKTEPGRGETGSVSSWREVRGVGRESGAAENQGPKLALSHRILSLSVLRRRERRHIDGKQPTELD